MSTVPSIALVVPVSGGATTFQRCMTAVDRLRPAPAEVVVVVDGTDQGEGAVARAHGARVLWTGQRAGPAAARNLGVSATSADVVFFIAADVLVPPGAIADAAEFFAANPGVHAAIGSSDADPPERNTASQYRHLLTHYTHQRGPVEGRRFWGACGLIRRDSFEALGGFRESDAGPGSEDIEFGYRLVAAGGRIHLLKHLEVGRMTRWEWVSLLRADFTCRALPQSALTPLTRHVDDDVRVDPTATATVALTGLSTMAALAVVVAPVAPAGGAALVLLVAALLLDRPLWRFFRDRRGAGFVLRVMPWHVCSHLCSAAAVGLAAARHLATAGQRRRARRAGEWLPGHTQARLPSADVRVRTPTLRS